MKHMLMNVMSGVEELLKRSSQPKTSSTTTALKNAYSTWEMFEVFERSLQNEEMFLALVCFSIILLQMLFIFDTF